MLCLEIAMRQLPHVYRLGSDAITILLQRMSDRGLYLDHFIHKGHHVVDYALNPVQLYPPLSCILQEAYDHLTASSCQRAL